MQTDWGSVGSDADAKAVCCGDERAEAEGQNRLFDVYQCIFYFHMFIRTIHQHLLICSSAHDMQKNNRSMLHDLHCSSNYYYAVIIEWNSVHVTFVYNCVANVLKKNQILCNLQCLQQGRCEHDLNVNNTKMQLFVKPLTPLNYTTECKTKTSYLS